LVLVTRGSITVLLGVLAIGCRSTAAASSALEPRTVTEPTFAESEESIEQQPKRRWEPELYSLPVPNFGDAVVVLPAPERTPAPLLVAAHGAGGDPAFDCDHWARLTRGEWFVLCPRGTPLSRRYEGSYYYRNHFELEREVVAMLAAARARHANVLRDEPGVYAGFSQGATMGALMVIEHGRDFRALVLVEGGFSEWTPKRARRFRETGGESVALICGGAGCTARARTSAQILERAGLRAHVEHAEGAGHTFLGSVAERAAWVFDEWPLMSDAGEHRSPER
jgi:predicted esterase